MSQAESSYQLSQNEMKAMTRELEAIRVSNESLLAGGHCYKQELEALQSHSNIISLQNNDL